MPFATTLCHQCCHQCCHQLLITSLAPLGIFDREADMKSPSTVPNTSKKAAGPSAIRHASAITSVAKMVVSSMSQHTAMPGGVAGAKGQQVVNRWSTGVCIFTRTMPHKHPASRVTHTKVASQHPACRVTHTKVASQHPTYSPYAAPSRLLSLNTSTTATVSTIMTALTTGM